MLPRIFVASSVGNDIATEKKGRPTGTALPHFSL